MKKTIIILLSIIITLVLSSCEGSTGESNRYREDSPNKLPVTFIEENLDKSLDSNKGLEITLVDEFSDDTPTKTEGSLNIKIDDYKSFMSDGLLSHVKFFSSDFYFDGSVFYYDINSQTPKKITGLSDVTVLYLMESKLDFIIPSLDLELFTVSSVSESSTNLVPNSDVKSMTHINNIYIQYNDAGMTEIDLAVSAENSTVETTFRFQFSEVVFNEPDLSSTTFVEEKMPYNMDPQFMVDTLVMAKRTMMTDFSSGIKGSTNFKLNKSIANLSEEEFYEANLDFNIFTEKDMLSDLSEIDLDQVGFDLSSIYDSFRFNISLKLNSDIVSLALDNLDANSILPLVPFEIDKTKDITLKASYLGEGNINLIVLNGESCIYKQIVTLEEVFESTENTYLNPSDFYDTPIYTKRHSNQALDNKTSVEDTLKDILGSLRSEVTSDYVRIYLGEDGLVTLNKLILDAKPEDINIPYISNIEVKTVFDGKGQLSESSLKLDSKLFNIFTLKTSLSGNTTLEDFDAYIEEYSSYSVEEN